MLINSLLWVALAATLCAFIGRRLDIHPNLMRIVMLAGLGIITGCLITIGGWAWVGVMVTVLLCVAIVWASEEEANARAAVKPNNARHSPERPRQATTKGTVDIATPKPESRQPSK
ncbi:hypothetical protein [Carnimonas bestiolae]|uniref:hypothetical protein n=1 Tax=Carnimonas bestiolae TaxID=3402172 RepID=UPI003EDC9F9E